MFIKLVSFFISFLRVFFFLGSLSSEESSSDCAPKISSPSSSSPKSKSSKDISSKSRPKPFIPFLEASSSLSLEYILPVLTVSFRESLSILNDPLNVSLVSLRLLFISFEVALTVFVKLFFFSNTLLFLLEDTALLAICLVALYAVKADSLPDWSIQFLFCLCIISY